MLCELTTGVVTGSQENTTGRLPLPDHMAGGWRGQDTILTDQELLDAVGSTDLGDHLDDFGVPKAAVASDDQGGTY